VKQFPRESLLKAYFDKMICSPSAKTCLEIQSLCRKLREVIMDRNENLNATNDELIKTTEMMTIKKEGELRWKMETNISTRDQHWTIWYLSSHGKFLELQRYLQQENISINEPDVEFGMTALHYACKRNDLEIAKLLLSHGADENARAADGRSPLHFAACYGSVTLVLELLAMGAVYDAKDNYQCTALDLAKQNKNESVVKTLTNWTTLIPSEEIITNVIEDRVNGCSQKNNRSTPLEIRSSMSLRLQVLTNRVTGARGSLSRS